MNTNYKKSKMSFNVKLCFWAACLLISTNTIAQIIEDGTYQIYNSVHAEVMTTETGDDYDAFMTAPDETNDFQLWSFVHQGNDIYKIENIGSGNTLGINDGWCGQFGDVKANFMDSASNVEFKVSAADAEDTYVFEIAFTECNFGSVNDPVKAFDIQDGASGAEIQTFDVDVANPNQQFEIVIPGTLSNESFEEATDLVMYYNNIGRKLNVNSNQSIHKIVVYNLGGKLVKTVNLNNSQETSIDFNALDNGLYLVQFSSGNRSHTAKVVIY